MSGDKVANEKENAHNDMFGYRDDVRPRNFQYLDTMVDSSVEVDVIGPDARGNAELQLRGL